MPRSLTDKQGLDIAYGREDGVYKHGHTIYVAGTKSLRDVAIDLTLPVGGADRTARYERAMVLANDPQVHRIVGHSLGGAVAIAVGRRRPKLHVQTYGAPAFLRRRLWYERRDRDTFDPVSVFDTGATTHRGYLPHTVGRV